MRSSRNVIRRSGYHKPSKPRHSVTLPKRSAPSRNQGTGGISFDFLALPPEIRVMIYEALIPSQINLMVVEPEFLSPYKADLFNMPPERSYPQVLMLKKLPGYEKQQTELQRTIQFFRCYPSLYREVQPLLYSGISVSSCLTYSKNTLWQYNVSFCRRLQHLDLWYEFYPTKDDRILQRHPALRTLTLRFMRTSQIDKADEDLSKNRDVSRRVRQILNSPFSCMTRAYVSPFKAYQHFSYVVCVASGTGNQGSHSVSGEEPKVWSGVDLLA